MKIDAAAIVSRILDWEKKNSLNGLVLARLEEECARHSITLTGFIEDWFYILTGMKVGEEAASPGADLKA